MNQYFIKGHIVLFALMGFVGSGCNTRCYDNVSHYNAFINNQSNGLVKKQSSDLIVTTAMYIPAELRVLSEIKDELQVKCVDSLLQYYANSINIRFYISAGNGCPVNDLKYYGVSTKEEFSELQTVLNHKIKECFRLEYKGQLLLPKLCHLEQDYGYSGKLNYQLIFIPSKDGCVMPVNYEDGFKLLFNDRIFSDHSYEFSFEQKHLKAIPKIRLES